MRFLHCILSCILFNATYAFYGLPCSSDAGCTSENEVCIAGRCGCKPNTEIRWFYTNHGLRHKCSDKVKTCISDQDCWGKLGDNHKICNENGICECGPGYISMVILSDSYCIEMDKPSGNSFLKNCLKSTVPVQTCHPEDNVFCNIGRCMCYPGYYGDNKTRMCRPKSEYLQANSLKEYKVKPGVFCSSEDDCIAGLKCINFLCECPEGCIYNARIESCDCGYFYDSDEYFRVWSYTFPSIVGSILGFIISFCGFVFLCCMDSDEDTNGENDRNEQTLTPLAIEVNQPVTVPVVNHGPSF